MWNHRIVKDVYDSPVEGESPYEQFSIKEVYYDNEGKAHASTKDAVGVAGDSVKELKQTLLWMWIALKSPVLNQANIPEEGAMDFLKQAEEEMDALTKEEE